MNLTMRKIKRTSIPEEEEEDEEEEEEEKEEERKIESVRD